MKNILLLMLGLAAGTASFAHELAPQDKTLLTHLVMNDRDRIRFYVQPLQTKGQLSIQDANDRIIYQQTMSLKKGLRQQLDISNLAAGTYRLTLSTEQKTVTQAFVVQPGGNESFVVQ